MSKSTLKLVDEFVDEGVPAKEPEYHDKEADLQRALELSLKELEHTKGPARPVVIKETESGKLQPLLEVQGKGKEKVTDEQAARDLLTLQTPKRKSSADQFIFQRRTTLTTGPSRDAESPLLDAELDRVDSEMESDKPDISIEGHGGSKLVKTEVLKTVEPEQTIKEHIREEFTSTMNYSVSTSVGQRRIPRHRLQLLSQLQQQHPPTTTPTTTTATTTSITTTTTLPPPPPQPQQITTNLTLLQHINKLAQGMPHLAQANLALEERLDKHGSRLYKLSNLNIPQKVSVAVDEIVTNAVDWAMQASL
ncbi:monodehydroascorbate reductase [Tanacetum coccineum]